MRLRNSFSGVKATYAERKARVNSRLSAHLSTWSFIRTTRPIRYLLVGTDQLSETDERKGGWPGATFSRTSRTAAARYSRAQTNNHLAPPGNRDARRGHPAEARSARRARRGDHPNASRHVGYVWPAHESRAERSRAPDDAAAAWPAGRRVRLAHQTPASAQPFRADATQGTAETRWSMRCPLRRRTTWPDLRSDEEEAPPIFDAAGLQRVVPRARIELATPGFSDLCSTD